MRSKLTFRQWVGYTGFALVLLLTAAVAVWRGDILRAGLDPQIPFQTYEPPAAPDYDDKSAWALLNARAPGAGAGEGCGGQRISSDHRDAQNDEH